MRIKELAKELETTPRELMRQAKALGDELDSEVKSPMSSLEDSDVDILKSKFKKPLSIDVDAEKKRLSDIQDRKGEAMKEAASAKIAAEQERLQAGIERAKQIDALIHGAAAGDEAAEPAAPAPSEPSAAQTAQAAASEPPSAAPAAGAAPATEASATAPIAAPRPIAAKPIATRPIVAKPAKVKRPPRPFHPEDEEDDGKISLSSRGKIQEMGASERQMRRGGNGRDDARPQHGRPPFGKHDDRRGGAAQKSAPGANKNVTITGPVVVKDLAEMLGVRPNVIIAGLMKLGILASINQRVDQTTATRVAQSHGFFVDSSSDRPRRNAENKPTMKRIDADDFIPEDKPEDLKPRPPVVTFLGHVDHGKTSLMDCIRKATVAAGEAGGITQHIGAYTVNVNGRSITFLDTPGHEAFSAMRARGANLTDIAVIIIAADDGIMPQTKEAIRYAREAHVTIMVAINKIDLPQANLDRVMNQLQKEGLTPEEWGGDVVVCKVSAKTREGIDNLLDMILLQSDVMELSANPDRRADGTVIEARMEPGRGPTASVLITGGTLNVGDVVLCGEHYGKLKAIIDPSGKMLKSAGPSQAVRLMGLSGVPDAGAEFRVIPNEKRAKQIAEEHAEKKKEEKLSVDQAVNSEDIFKAMDKADRLCLNLVLRADVQGSVEAIQDSISQIKSEKVSVAIIHAGTGSITSTDIETASSGNAAIIGFHVSPESGVNAEARHFGVRIKTFRIIYELLDFVKDEMLALLPVEYKEVVKGHAIVKQVISLSKMGNVAGSVVNDGTIVTTAKARVVRNKAVIFTGPFLSIKHFKDEAREVAAGQECGIRINGFDDFRENDVIECFALEALPKSL